MMNRIDGAANVIPAQDGRSFDIYPRRSADRCAPSLTVTTIHISCKSDTYLGIDHKYGGIIIYARKGKGEWYTANGTHCKSGDLVIMETDTREFKELQKIWRDEPGQVHGIIYRKAFGESCKGKKVVGEGFGIMNGQFKIVSGAFNPADDGYHDNSSLMNKDSARYVEAVVNIWKSAGPNFPEKQNYSVKELRDGWSISFCSLV